MNGLWGLLWLQWGSLWEKKESPLKHHSDCCCRQNPQVKANFSGGNSGKENTYRDFPGGPVVKNLLCNAVDVDSIPGQGTKIPHASRWLSLNTSTTEPMGSGGSVFQLESSHAASKDPAYATKTQRSLEWVAIPFSRGSSQPRDQTQVSCIAGEFFTSWATRKV